ncbi:MAG: TonB-dependent receptor plug domain-containing protein [Gammaproteobacteria bacterium]
MKLNKLLGVIALPLFAITLVAQEVEEVVITGSYIKSSPTDGASPVEIIGRDEIDNLNATTIADITANIAVNSGSENNTDAFTQGSTQGTSNINIRGLGLSSTLVLIDGKRQTLYSSTANDGSVFVNTSAIPVIALDRVEVLKEGAASVYGSDAVAGVVNYILRKDFTGLEIEVSSQEADIGGQTDDRLGAIWGFEGEAGNFVLALSQLNRSPMSGAALNPSLAQLGISTLGTSFVMFAPSTVESGPYAGTYGRLQTVPDPSCVENKGILIPVPGGQRCGFFYGDRFNVVNDEDHSSVFASFTNELANGVTFNMNYTLTEIDVNDNPQSPSYPALSYTVPSRAILPGQAGNPFGVPVLWLGRPLGSAFPSPNAPREIENDRFAMSLSGQYNNGFSWDFSVTQSSDSAYGRQPDTSTSKFAAAIAGNGGPSGNQSWNLANPTSNSQELIDWISTAQQTWGSTDLSVVDYVITGEAGGMDIAAGLQFRDEEFTILRGPESIAQFNADGSIAVPADLLFLGGGLNSDATRNAKAAFIEASNQLTDRLELRGALRYEELADDSAVNPKISARYEMSDELVLRASASTSFREPSLSQLTATTIGLQGIQDFDTDGNPVGGTAFIRISQSNNPSLDSEESDNINLGLIWSPNDNFNLKLDYWAIDYTDLITIESAQGKVIANPNDPDVKRTVDGSLIGVNTSYFNASAVDTNGFDLEMTYDFDTGLGSAQVGLKAMHMLQYEIPLQTGEVKDVVGLFNHDNFARSLPETKMVLHGALQNGNHSLVAFGRWVSDYETTRALDPIAQSRGFTQDIDSFFSVDLKYSYNFEMNDNDLLLTLGMTNAFDEEVPLVYDAANWSYDPKHHDPRGRMVYVGLKYSIK